MRPSDTKRNAIEHGSLPHPFAHGKVLQRKILRIFKDQEKKVEDRPKPIELVLVNVCTGSGDAEMLKTFPKRETGDLQDPKNCRLHQKSPVRINGA